METIQSAVNSGRSRSTAPPLRRKNNPIPRAVLYGVLILLAFFMLFPLFWLVRSSLMTSREIFTMPIQWLPEKAQWKNYADAMTAIPFVRYFSNTLLIVAVNLIGVIFSNSFVAFGFARIRFKGRNFVFAVLLLTMMIPWSILLIPQFIGWKIIGAYNTYWPLTAGSFFASGFNVFLLRQFYASIPLSYDEAAFMDGANYLQIYWKIILPLSRPALTTVGVFTFMNVWNDFMGPLIYLSDSDKWTLSLGLQSFIGQYTQQWQLLMAASTITVLPMILVFFICQRAFIEGIALSGVKG